MSMLSKIRTGIQPRPHFIGLYGPGGVGKCLGRGTQVMRSDGTLTTVESIVTGDSLMGPDGMPRTVVGTNRGVGPLFKIQCNKGESFVCNDAHMLTVSHTSKQGIFEIQADEYAKIPECKRKYYTGVRSEVDFPEADLPLKPYFVGLWIGDGTLRGCSVQITKPEEEIHAAVCDQAQSFGLRGKRYDYSDKVGRSGIIGYERGESSKPFPDAFKKAMIELGWNGVEKTIPFKYLRSSRRQRLELLAGLIDSDGHLVQSCFEITTKHKGLADSILWLARSVGMQATCRLKESSIKELGFTGSYYRIFISGHTDQIPTRTPRKQASPRMQVKNPLRFGMKAEAIGVGEYFGFEVDGDHRFLLGDFTITHNSTFAASAPKPIFLGTDDGVGALDVASFPIITTWQEARAAIGDLINEKHDYQTATIDTVNGLEPLLWSHLCTESRCSSIEEVDGGYGKGYVRAMEQWVEFFRDLKKLRAKMNVICLGHSEVKTIEDPHEGERFDRYLLKMNKQAAAIFHESVDCMFFAAFKTVFRKEKGARKSKARGDGTRVIYTEERPAFMAKSRFDLPFEMDLSWDAFVTAAGACVPRASVDEIATVFKGIEAEATAYLVSIEWLAEGMTIADLPAAKRKPILAKKDSFIAAVRKFSTPEPETTEQ